jgi:hypothetical protein
MNKGLGTTVACLALGASLLAPAASAQRYHQRFHNQDRFIENYCGGSWDRDCNDWRDNRDRWDEPRYDRWYRDHHRHQNFGAENTAAAIFGFAAAVIGNGIVNGAGGSHGAACDARYRSYDWQSDTYMGFDGERHYCRL